MPSQVAETETSGAHGGCIPPNPKAKGERKEGCGDEARGAETSAEGYGSFGGRLGAMAGSNSAQCTLAQDKICGILHVFDTMGPVGGVLWDITVGNVICLVSFHHRIGTGDFSRLLRGAETTADAGRIS